jgi:curved DNA-binding protein CbpA
MADDPYQVLGVAPDADLAHIRRAYLARLRVNHPDVRPGDAEAEQRTRELNHAWEQVRNRRRAGAEGDRSTATRPRQRPATKAYSHTRRDFRAAFTTATLRVALLVLAFGLLVLLILSR